MPKTIKIAHKEIGQGRPCFVVAEVGINHNGNVKLAKKMIEAAKNCGADAVKFQAFKAKDFIADKKQLFSYFSQGKRVKGSMYQMFKRLEFSESEFKELFRCAKKKKIICFATPQNFSDLKILLNLKMPAIKVGSDDLTNLPLLKSYALVGLPMIISTGMADLFEIKEAVETIKKTGNQDLAILKCTSSYPTRLEDVNLRGIETLKKNFQAVIGFSDHTKGTTAALGAVACGACLIEKHFTLNNNLAGPDHWFSSSPKELKELVKGIRAMEKTLGSATIAPTLREKNKERKLSRRSIVASVDIRGGQKITLAMLEYKRPGTGLLPKFANLVVGKKARANVKKGELIALENLKQ